MTLVVNLYGGPGVGKSTTAAIVFGNLKQAGIDAELVTEFAKDLAWEDRRVIKCRPFVFGEQLWRIERLLGEVDVVVTDSPLLMDLAYSEHYGPHWSQVVLAEHRKLNTLDVFLHRPKNHPYNPRGRFQGDVEEARKVDVRIQAILEGFLVPYMVSAPGGAYAITEHVLSRLDPERPTRLHEEASRGHFYRD